MWPGVYGGNFKQHPKSFVFNFWGAVQRLKNGSSFTSIE